MEEKSFINEVLEAFKNIHKEIEKGSLEHDIRPRLVKYFVETVLGYSGFDYRYEKGRTDLTIFDNDKFPLIKIETKKPSGKPSESVDNEDNIEQAFSYIEETTKYAGLTNFLQFKLWEIKGKDKELKISLDFDAILKHKRFHAEDLDSREKSQILFFSNLTKESLFDPKKYAQFDETYAKIDITKKRGFNKLLERLDYIVHELLWTHVLKSFGEYKEGYKEYLEKIKQIDELIKINSQNKEFRKNLLIKKENIEKEFKRFKSFSGFISWKDFSGKSALSDEQVREIFCKETIYVLLNKLIFIRICEDKELLAKNISNGGIKLLRERIFDKNRVYREILNFAYRGAYGLYSHFYEPGILDWYTSGDGELDNKLNRVLWILNQFNFSHVDRDILGNLYEKYLSREERKKLGEFYTPIEVIDYILTAIGYTYNSEIRDKDLLDFSCGSGGFLVRATRRLISKYLVVFGKIKDKKELKDPKNWKEILNRLSVEEAKIILEAIEEHIYGFDINPFACHIAEMNLLFQIIDLYQKIRKEDKKYKLKRFNIYRTNSLEPPEEQKNMYEFKNSYSKSLAEDKEEIDAIKRKKFDFVIGNPPYVRKEKISSFEKYNLAKFYPSIYHGDNDYCVYFLFKGIKWLNDNGRFGYIVSSKFTKTRYGQYIRAFIAENTHIAEFIDLRGSQVFANVTVDPVILILDKRKDNDIRVTNVKKDFSEKYREWNLRKLIYHIQGHKRDYQDKYIDSFSVDQESLLKNIKEENGKKVCEEWKLINVEELGIFDKIKKNSEFNLEYIAKIYCGPKTGLDTLPTSNQGVFLIDEETIKKEKLERSVIKPVIKGSDIKRWKFLTSDLYMINLTHKDYINDYPNIKLFLEKFKEELQKRTRIRAWYALREPRWIANWNIKKIVTPDISIHNNFTIINEGLYYIQTVYGIEPLKNRLNDLGFKDYEFALNYLLGLLNSKVLEYYFKRISSYLGKKGHRYTSQHLRFMRIKKIQTGDQKQLANQITKKVNEILEINKTQRELKTINFEDLLKNKEIKKLSNFASFSIRDRPKFYNLRIKEDRIYLNLSDYIEIKDKIIFSYVYNYLKLIKNQLKKSDNLRELIYNIEVPIDKEDIKEILKKLGPSEKEKESIKIVKQLEKEIDELVYKLYNINQKEQKIIEESIK